jgi:hypothetical protein
LVVIEAGSNAHIVCKTLEKYLAIPLGSRPSIGAGSWLQGVIGHLARLHGLTSDAVVVAVVVSIDSDQILYIGVVPSHYRPAEAVRPVNKADLV